MSGKKTSASEDMARTSQPFTEQLSKALENFGDPVWLGENSPLAAPYFLGEYLLRKRDARISSARQRGEVLREALREAVGILTREQLDQASHLNYGDLIQQSFLNPEIRTAEAIAAELLISRATYYRHLPRAIEQLEEIFIRILKPALRLELPRHQPNLVGRDDLMARCSQALQQGKTLGLTGLGGIGKTTLGANLALKLGAHATFWFTIRPGLNDRLNSLIFALGYFFHRLGSSSLWGQLVAAKGQVNAEMALSLLRHDAKNVRGATPVLCFDEVDLLRPTEVEAHARLLAFLEGLRGLAPMLLIGQHLILEPDMLINLTGLGQGDIKAMLAQARIQLSSDNLARLETYTQGNPRLLELFIALHLSGEPLIETLSTQSGVPTTEYLLDRIWRRLGEMEQQLLTALAVFRQPAPDDAWPEALTSLVERHLAQVDGRGGVALLPAFRDVIYRQLAPENRQVLHLQAARIRAMRGEYTAAAFHYIQAGQPHIAIWLWHEHRQQEIDQGQTEAALLLFREISLNQLERKDQEALIVLRGTLYKLIGEYDLARRDLRRTFWDSPILKAQARRLEGDIAELNSEFSRANKAYREGLETVERLASEVALFHKNLGWVLMRQKELDQAWRQARLAEYEAENLQGYIQVERGNFSDAEAHYRRALTLAETLRHAHGEAKTRDNLAALLARQGRFDEAVIHWHKAAQLFERINYQASLAGVKVNLAFGYNLAGQPEAAIAAAAEAMILFEKLGESYGQAVAAQNLAEAHLSSGNLAEAEQFAWRVVRTEETSTLPDGLRVLGEVKLAQKQFDEAERFIRQAISVAQQNQDRYLEAYAWRALGQLYQTQQQLDEAEHAFGQALELFEGLELPDEIDKTRRMRNGV